MINQYDIQRLAKDAGIHFPGAMDFLPAGVSHDMSLAMDAQPGLITVSSSGVPGKYNRSGSAIRITEIGSLVMAFP